MDGLRRKRKVEPDADDELAWSTTRDAASLLLPVAHAPKRPRIEQQPPRKLGRAHYKPPSRPPLNRIGSDLEDIGVVLDSEDAGPLPTSLLRRQVKPTTIDPNSPHIPAFLPTVNRQTLKELDLPHILRNPQLCHDILFDPGLQFRPNCSRRKRDQADKYWAAILRELDTGCTCVPFDLQGNLCTRSHCVCSQGPCPDKPKLVPSRNLVVLRMPSRIRPLLKEFLEVLLMVIQPLSGVSALYVNPDMFKAQMEEHASQAAYIQSIFDPELIEQELRRGVFDPSGMFQIITSTLRAHCAPMRDASMDAMILCARNARSLSDAVKAMKMCMEILELMKLDIANHQLQALRPHLTRTSAQIELRTFRKSRKQLTLTKAWLRKAVSHPSPDNRQILLGVLKGLVDLVFFPPSTDSYPETLHLDMTRLNHFASEAKSICKMYMYLLLHRQLSPVKPPTSSSISELKIEIRDLGLESVNEVVLQIVRRISKAPVPSKHSLDTATRWAQTHVVEGSSLSTMLKNRLATSLLNAVVALSPLHGPHDEEVVADQSTESVRVEITALAEKVSRMAQVHLNAYLPIYEGEGFLQ